MCLHGKPLACITIQIYPRPSTRPKYVITHRLRVATLLLFPIYVIWVFQNESSVWNFVRACIMKGASFQEPTCQCRRHRRQGFDPWVGKVPWRRSRQRTPVSLPGESHGQRNLMEPYSPIGLQSRTQLKRFSMHSFLNHRFLLLPIKIPAPSTVVSDH